jgi:hypothetical protein
MKNERQDYKIGTVRGWVLVGRRECREKRTVNTVNELYIHT